ncbi:MAG TPA: hypothetical protein VK874_03630 [Gaiellaceae bacterium]|nr:hypothetical protein [Gaiellaceae bacterium]
MASTGTNARVRIEVGFDGGQVMNALVTKESADALERHFGAGGEGVVPLDAEDGRYMVALRRVVYVTRFAREGRVGFAG